MSLLRNWSATKEALLEGLQPEIREICDHVLDNTRDHVQNNGGSDSFKSEILKLILPITRHIVGTTKLYDIVGVQPLFGDCFTITSLEQEMRVRNYVQPSIHRMGLTWNFKKFDLTPSFDEKTEMMVKRAIDACGNIEQLIINRMKEAFNYSNRIEYGPYENLSEFLDDRMNELYDRLPEDFVGDMDYTEWAIVSETALEILKQDGFEPSFSDEKLSGYYTYTAPLEKIGRIDTMDIYFDEYAKDDLLLGFKASNDDAPLIYAPYVTLDIMKNENPSGNEYDFISHHTLFGDDETILRSVSYLKFKDEFDDEDY